MTIKTLCRALNLIETLEPAYFTSDSELNYYYAVVNELRKEISHLNNAIIKSHSPKETTNVNH